MGDVLPTDEQGALGGGSPSDLGRGSRLGRYELLVPVARGGMAHVWAARHDGQRGFSRTVAVKTILPHLAEIPEFERMFVDEARIASAIQHPNVAQIYELGEEGRVLYLAMEWVNGESLARIVRPGADPHPIDPRVAARVVADASAGLHAAHELTDEHGRRLNVVHRDVSPHNILVTADGFVKVVDFGVVKALGQLHDATSAGQLKGKIAYMAPEQITGAPVDQRSDVFSLACVLYEATTGQKPFRGQGDHQVMHALLHGDYARPSSLIRGYPPELEEIIAQGLAVEPARRFATAQRFRQALEEWLAQGGPVVTQANVAQVVHARVGDIIDDRRERIRRASGAEVDFHDPRPFAEPPRGTFSPPPHSMSGVQAAQGGPRALDSATGPSTARFRHPPAVALSSPQIPVGPVAYDPHATLALGMAPSPVAPLPRNEASASYTSRALRPATGPHDYVLAVGAGLVTALVIGAALFAALRPPRAPRVGADVASGPSQTVVLAAPPPPLEAKSAPIPPVASVPAVVSPTAPSAALAPVSLVAVTVVPTTAVVTVDGRVDEARPVLVPRPSGPSPVRLEAQAKGYTTEVLELDGQSAERVTMRLKTAHSTAKSTGPRPTGPKPVPTHTKRPPSGLPDNPY